MKIEPLEPGYTYHIYNRGNNKQTVFFDEKNYRFFMRKMSDYLPIVGDVYAFCLMRNHYHIVIRIKDKEDLPEKYQINPSQVFSNLFNSYVKLVNLTTNRSGSLFEKNFERKKITTEAYLKEVILYVHLNPFKDKGLSNCSDYPYSSAVQFKTGNYHWVKSAYVIDLFGGRENFWYMHEIGLNRRRGFDETEFD